MPKSLRVLILLIAVAVIAYLGIKHYASLPETYESEKVEDGMGNKIDVKVLVELDKVPLKTKADKEHIKSMIWDTEFWAKDKCRNPVSFKPYPKSEFFVYKSDSGYTVSLNYLAANAYGTEGELTAICNFDNEFKATSKY